MIVLAKQSNKEYGYAALIDGMHFNKLNKLAKLQKVEPEILLENLITKEWIAKGDSPLTGD